MTYGETVTGPDGHPLDQIRLTGVTATGYHGVLPEERVTGQTFRADVVLHLDTSGAAVSDDLDATVSYAEVAEDVHAILAGEAVDLVETVAERIAAVVLARPAVHAVDVRVHKPDAPIAVPFEDVEIVVRRDRARMPSVAAPVLAAAPVPEPGSAVSAVDDAPFGSYQETVPEPFQERVQEPVEVQAVPAPPALVVVPDLLPDVDDDAAPDSEAFSADAVAAEPAVDLPDDEPEPEVDPLDRAPEVPVDTVIALGANLGDPQGTLRAAVTDIDRVPGVQVMEVSPLARTAAVGPEQPDYLNAVLLVRTTLSPRDLLSVCQEVEMLHGRVREERWGPRTLDVDVIQYGALTVTSDDLELPHPRAHERAFVLVPWAELDPEAVLGGLGGGPVAQLAATAPDRGGIRWLALDWLTEPALTGAVPVQAEAPADVEPAAVEPTAPPRAEEDAPPPAAVQPVPVEPEAPAPVAPPVPPESFVPAEPPVAPAPPVVQRPDAPTPPWGGPQVRAWEEDEPQQAWVPEEAPAQPQYTEPQPVEQQPVEPQYSEPQYSEPQYVEPQRPDAQHPGHLPAEPRPVEPPQPAPIPVDPSQSPQQPSAWAPPVVEQPAWAPEQPWAPEQVAAPAQEPVDPTPAWPATAPQPQVWEPEQPGRQTWEPEPQQPAQPQAWLPEPQQPPQPQAWQPAPAEASPWGPTRGSSEQAPAPVQAQAPTHVPAQQPAQAPTGLSAAFPARSAFPAQPATVRPAEAPRTATPLAAPSAADVFPPSVRPAAAPEWPSPPPAASAAAPVRHPAEPHPGGVFTEAPHGAQHGATPVYDSRQEPPAYVPVAGTGPQQVTPAPAPSVPPQGPAFPGVDPSGRA